ncbi:MAG: hypothetical protein JNJ44_09425 [Zoogloeaceae bacterium]|nr:hypothetical protein [Zoogloeaceae bacterium]
MRSIQVFIIVLCLIAGLYLSTGSGFFLPDRWHPETGILLNGFSARLLGAALLIIAATGVIALKHFAPGRRERYNPAWHRRYFLLLITAIVLISAALWLGERGPTPGWRPSPAASRESP